MMADVLTVPTEVKVYLYRIFTELLNITLKYADATQVTISIQTKLQVNGMTSPI